MVLKYVKSQSEVYPELVDTTSSKKVVYLRRNIVKVPVSDEQTEEEHFCYEYDEAKLTKKEYEQYLKELDAVSVQRLENQIIVTEQTITDLDLQDIEVQQAITDMDIRLMMLEV